MFVAGDSSPHTPLEILYIIRHEIKSIAFFSFHVKLKHRILQSTCSESHNRSTAAEKLMLDNSSRLK